MLCAWLTCSIMFTLVHHIIFDFCDMYKTYYRNFPTYNVHPGVHFNDWARIFSTKIFIYVYIWLGIVNKSLIKIICLYSLTSCINIKHDILHVWCFWKCIFESVSCSKVTIISPNCEHSIKNKMGKNSIIVSSGSAIQFFFWFYEKVAFSALPSQMNAKKLTCLF